MTLEECVAQANTSTSEFVRQQRESVEEACWKTLIDAVTGGDIAQAESALKKGADVNRGERFVASSTALNKAVSRGDSAMVKLLLSAGADASGSDPNNSPIRNAVATDQGTEGSRVEVLRLLIEAGVPWQTEEIMGMCALKGNIGMLKLIIPLVKANQQALDGMLVNACSGLSANAVSFLLNNGADVGVKTVMVLF